MSHDIIQNQSPNGITITITRFFQRTLSTSDIYLSLAFLLPPFFLLYIVQSFQRGTDATTAKDLRQRQRRQLAWVLSLVTSVVQSCLGCWTAWHYFILPGGYVHRDIFTDQPGSRFSLSFFSVFMTLDIILGLVFYHEHLDWLTGYGEFYTRSIDIVRRAGFRVAENNRRIREREREKDPLQIAGNVQLDLRCQCNKN